MSEDPSGLERLVISFRGLRVTVEPEQPEATGSASSERSAATGARTSTGSLAWEVVSQEERLEVPEDYYRLFTPVCWTAPQLRASELTSLGRSAP